MQAIQDFFEHRLVFQRYNASSEHSGGIFLLDTACYRSKLILDPQDIGIYNSGDIYDKVKSLLHRLASKHISTEHEGYRYVDSSFDIGIMTNPGEDDSNYKKLVMVNVEPHGDVFEFREIDFIQFDPYSVYSYPIEIYIDVGGSYQWNEVVEEYDESEDEPITLKSYKEDKCVVCLNNEP